MRYENGIVEANGNVSETSAQITVVAGPGSVAVGMPERAIIRALFETLEERGIRYCHWKSNIRLEETLAGAEDIDLLVDRRDASLFHAALLKNGFKLAQSRSGIVHPGVFHAFGLDGASSELVHLHAYHQIVTGDSLVKSYRLPIEGVLLERTHHVHGVRIPTPEVELVLFAIRIALKHVSPIEILLVNRHYHKVSRELTWLRKQSDAIAAETLCTSLFPNVTASLFRGLLNAIETDGAVAKRIFLGWRVARRLRAWRRVNPVVGAILRLWRVLALIAGRVRRRRELTLQTGGMIVALVGPKATGKSTLGRELAARLGRHLDVAFVHAGKPPATALTLAPRLLAPLARRLLPGERLANYEESERRREKRYSLPFVLWMTLLAYDRRRLLRRAQRAASGGAVVISDRYPSQSVGAIDSCCFDDSALAKCHSPLKRWLMQRERALYSALPRPALVMRLAAPIDIAVRRDAQRSKFGGPDPEAVHRRWELETNAVFSGTPVIDVDTDRPVEETVRKVVQSVWAAL